MNTYYTKYIGTCMTVMKASMNRTSYSLYATAHVIVTVL